MSAPQTVTPGETWLGATMVAKADGTPIITGTVNLYLLALTGANAGKWYRNSDSTWQASETANALTYEGGADWAINLTNSPFTAGVLYDLYAKESGALNVPYGMLLRCQLITVGQNGTGGSFTAGTVTSATLAATQPAVTFGALVLTNGGTLNLCGGTLGSVTSVVTTTNITNNTPTNGTVTLAANQDVRNVSGGVGGTTNGATNSQVITAINGQTSGTLTLASTVTTLTNNTPTNGTVTLAANQHVIVDSGNITGGTLTDKVGFALTSAERLAIGTATLASTVDTITLSKALEVITAALLGNASVSGSTVTYKKRDGTTNTVSITFDASGNRSSSSIL